MITCCQCPVTDDKSQLHVIWLATLAGHFPELLCHQVLIIGWLTSFHVHRSGWVLTQSWVALFSPSVTCWLVE
jgi:hypothetical protein